MTNIDNTIIAFKTATPIIMFKDHSIIYIEKEENDTNYLANNSKYIIFNNNINNDIPLKNSTLPLNCVKNPLPDWKQTIGITKLYYSYNGNLNFPISKTLKVVSRILPTFIIKDASDDSDNEYNSNAIITRNINISNPINLTADTTVKTVYKLDNSTWTEVDTDFTKGIYKYKFKKSDQFLNTTTKLVYVIIHEQDTEIANNLKELLKIELLEIEQKSILDNRKTIKHDINIQINKFNRNVAKVNFNTNFSSYIQPPLFTEDDILEIQQALKPDQFTKEFGDTFDFDNLREKIIKNIREYADFDQFIVGGAGDDTIDGGAGNDQINGGAGDDTIDGGAGNDQIGGGAGIDMINGGAGNDEIYGDDGDDTIEGGAGNDEINGNDGTDTAVYSGNSSDYTISFYTSNNIVKTSYQNDGYVKVVDNRTSGTEGTDKLYTIEKIQFADGTIDLNTVNDEINDEDDNDRIDYIVGNAGDQNALMTPAAAHD